MKTTGRRLDKLEATAAFKSVIEPPREDIEIEFVDVDGTVSDRMVISAGDSSSKRMDLRNPSI